MPLSFKYSIEKKKKKKKKKKKRGGAYDFYQ